MRARENFTGSNTPEAFHIAIFEWTNSNAAAFLISTSLWNSRDKRPILKSVSLIK